MRREGRWNLKKEREIPASLAVGCAPGNAWSGTRVEIQFAQLFFEKDRRRVGWVFPVKSRLGKTLEQYPDRFSHRKGDLYRFNFISFPSHLNKITTTMA